MKRGQSELRNPLGFLSPHAQESKPLVSRGEHRAAKRSQLADGGRFIGAMRSPQHETNGQDGNLLGINVSNLRRIERIEQRHSKRSSSQLYTNMYGATGQVKHRDVRLSIDRHHLDILHTHQDQMQQSSEMSWHRTQNPYSTEELQDFAIKELKTQKLFDHSKQSCLVLDTLPKNKEHELQRNLIREQKLQKKKQMMDQVHIQEDKLMYEKRRESQRLQMMKRAKRGQVSPFQQAPQPVHDDSARKGNCSRLCRQLNEFIENSARSRQSPPTQIGGSQRSHESARSVSKERPTGPPLTTFEIHGTSKRRYDAIHDTIQLFNFMKEERDAALQGIGRNRTSRRSPSLLAYNDSEDDPNNQQIYLEIEQRKLNDLQRQQHLEQYQESKKALVGHQPENEQGRRSELQAQSLADTKEATQFSLPKIKQARTRIHQSSMDHANLNRDLEIETDAGDPMQNENFNFVSNRASKLDEKQKLLQRLKQKHLKYNLDLTANAKYSRRSCKHGSTQGYSDRIRELYAGETEVAGTPDQEAKARLGKEAKTEQDAASKSQDGEVDLFAQQFSLKRALKDKQAIQSQTMKKFKDFDQIINDNLQNENRIVERSIEQLAVEINKAREVNRASRDESALAKLQSSPGSAGKETAVDDHAKHTKSNDVYSVEQKQTGLWRLMDKRNIFIDSSQASEAHTPSQSAEEKVVALPQSAQVRRNKNPYKKPQLQPSHLFDKSKMQRMFSPLGNDTAMSTKSASKHVRSHDNRGPSPKVSEVSPKDTTEQQDERNPIKNIFNEIIDHEKNIQQLRIIDSIKRGIQNSTRDRKTKIDIEQIKSLRSTALGHSNNQQLSKQEQLSSKLLVADLNLLSQQLGAPPQTQAAAVAEEDREEESEDMYSVKHSELTEAGPALYKSRSYSRASKYLSSYGSPQRRAKQRAPWKPIEEYVDRDLLPPGLDMSILPKDGNLKNSNDNKVRSPIQKQIFVQRAQERSVKLDQRERRLKALTNMIKQNRRPDPGTYQENFKSQLKPIQESFDMMSPGIRRKRRGQDELSSLFADSCISDSKMRSQLQELRSPCRLKDLEAQKGSPKRRRSIHSKEKDDKMQQLDLKIPSPLDPIHVTFDSAQTMAQESKATNQVSNLASSCSEKDKQVYESMNISLGHSTINRNILDPDISDEERQLLYQLFKQEQLLRLTVFVKRHKKRHRRKNPWDYDSDDSLDSLQSEGKPWRLYGHLPRNKATGEAYRIPSLEQIKQILLDGEKSTKQIVDALFPPHADYRDLLCALAIMHNSKLVSAEMLKKIRERDDKLAEYVNLITGEKIYQDGELLAGQMQHQGLTRHLSGSFSEYVGVCDQSSKRVANSLISKLKYFHKCKQSFNPKARHDLQADAEFNYFVACHDEMELAMPILEKVFHKTLCLYDYTLSPIHTNALRLAAKYFDEFINRLLFDNCGMSDHQFADVLQSLHALQDFKAITYRNQEFGPRSADAISDLAKRRIPNHLDELVLYNCKMTSNTVERLLVHLNEHSHLSKLALVDANLSDRCVKLLLELMTNNSHLHSLDISWNNLKSKSYEQLLLFLRDNRTMRSVNLAWNNLVDGPTALRESKKKKESMETKRPLSDRSGSASDMKQANMTKNSFMLSHAVSFDKNKMEDQEWQAEVGEHELLVADCLTRFIKYNANLLHLDLQGTGLTEYCMKMIAKALRKSRSIAGIHLSENPGLTEDTRKYLYERVRCKDSDFAIQRHLDLHIHEERVKSTNAEVNHRMFQDSIKLREINERKRAQKKKGVVGMQKDDRVCVVTRFNGHKGEMPGCPGQWQMLSGQHEECWICDKWTFSLVFFNPARLEDGSLWNQCDDLKQHVIKQMQLFHGDAASKMDVTEREAALYGSAFPVFANENLDECEEVHVYANFTNWQPKRMIPFLNYIEQIDKDRPDFLAKLKKENKISQRVECFEDLKEDELEAFEKELYEYRKKIREGHWERLLQKNLKYRKPAILNLDPRELERPQRLYILPVYIKSGKQNMLIKSQDTELGTCDWFFQRDIVDFRVEDISLFKKPLSSFLIQRKFQKEYSVFADWIEDDAYNLQKCKDDAAQHWKLLKMKVDPEDREKLIEVIGQHFLLLKHIFIWLQSLSDAYPGVTGLDFSRFMNNLKLIDRRLAASRVDQLFLRSIMLNDPRVAQPIVMYRWSFLESLIRICKERYIDTNQEKTYAAALTRLICKKMIPNLDQVGLEPWQETREDYVWTLDVDDLLRANLDGLQKVYCHFSSKRKITHDECCKIFTHYLPTPLPLAQAKFAYGMSKMSVAEEMRPTDYKGYLHMEFVEFLEMVCRVALLKFKGSDLDGKELPEKVEYVLEELLALVGVEKQKPQVEQVEVSESDEDY